MYSFGKKLDEIGSKNTAGSWFQCVRWEIGSNKYSEKKQQRGNGSNQYGAKLISTNTAENMCGKQFQPKWRYIDSNQYDRKLVPTNTAGKAKQQGFGTNQYGG